MENRFFKSALPVWIEGRDKEWNVSAGISYSARDLRSTTLTLTGASCDHGFTSYIAIAIEEIQKYL